MTTKVNKVQGGEFFKEAGVKLNKTKLLIASGIIALVVIALIVLFFGQPTGFVAMPGQQTASLPIKIGVIAPLTGPVANIGEYMQEGLELAREEINKGGGVNGRKIELLFEDTVVDPKLSVAAARKFIEVDEVKVIIGDYRSPNTLAVAPIAEENQVILISPGSQSDKISEAGDYVFRTQVNVDAEAKKLAEFTAGELSVKSVSLIVLNHDYGISFEEDFRSYFTGEIDDVHKVGSKETDFRTVLLKVKNSGSPVVVLAIGGKTGGLLANQAKELGLDTMFVATSIIQTADLVKAGGSSVEGWIYTYPYQPSGKEQLLFSRNYRERYGKENDVIAANSFDALMLISRAMRKCDEDTSCIKEFLYNVKNYQGASGTLSFDSKGDVLKPIALKTVRNGKFVPYNSSAG